NRARYASLRVYAVPSDSAQIDVRSNVCCWGVSGLVVLALSLAAHDPSETSTSASDIGIYGMSNSLTGLRTRELHHLAPLLGFFGDEFSEVGRRARKHCAAQVDEASLDLRISKSDVNFPVELVDDVGGCVPWCANASPSA